MRLIVVFLVGFCVGGIMYWWGVATPNPTNSQADGACDKAALTAAKILRAHQDDKPRSKTLKSISKLRTTPGLEDVGITIGREVLAVVNDEDYTYFLNIPAWDPLEFGAIVGVGCKGALKWRKTENRVQALKRKIGRWWNRDAAS